jgi:hypothetical protein
VSAADDLYDRALVLAFVEAHWSELTLREACRLSLEDVVAVSIQSSLYEPAAIG